LGAFPNFFVIGAAKAATTSLYQYLKQHPEIYVPQEKEPHFFSEAASAWSLATVGLSFSDEGAYRALFKDVLDQKAIGEFSVSYLWDKDTPHRLKQAAPDARIVVSLRDPVNRAFSHYMMDLREGFQTNPHFLEALQQDFAQEEKGWGVSHLYVELGLYCDQLQRYFDVFGRDRVLVLFAEDLHRNPVAELKKLFRFLGVNEDVAYTIDLSRRHNSFAMPRNEMARFVMTSRPLRRLSRIFAPRYLRRYLRDHVLLRKIEKPPIPVDAHNFLRGIYRDDVLRLSQMLNVPELPEKWNLKSAQ
jgi:hypothetical protein